MVEGPTAGARLDHALAALIGISHAAARRLVEAGAVQRNGRRAAKGARVLAGDRITVAGALPTAEGLSPRPQPELPLTTLLVDEDVVVVDKPAGVASHPLRAGERGTLAGALVGRYPECAGASVDPREAGLCHRLDTGTSGVLLAARHRVAWQALRDAFGGGRADKEYVALVGGQVLRPGQVDRALRHAPGDARRVECVDDDAPGALPARTAYAPLSRGPAFSLVRASTSTGRLHQVRAHLAAAGHPIVGDALYGGAAVEGAGPGFYLHAARLRIPHPRRGLLDVSAPLPESWSPLLARLGLHDTPG